MSWGCNPENHPDGCGWANRVTYPTVRMEEWWCDLCERCETRVIPPAVDHAAALASAEATADTQETP